MCVYPKCICACILAGVSEGVALAPYLPRVCVCMPALRVCVYFVYDLTRVSEGEAFAHRLLGMCACMPVVCFNRASPSVVSLAMYVYP